jgi:hypothetical protein
MNVIIRAVAVILLYLTLPGAFSEGEQQLFVYDSNWFKAIKAPVLDSSNTLLTYCKSINSEDSSPNPYSNRPLFVHVFTQNSQESIRFLQTFNKLYYHFVDNYGGSQTLLIFALKADHISSSFLDLYNVGTFPSLIYIKPDTNCESFDVYDYPSFDFAEVLVWMLQSAGL